VPQTAVSRPGQRTSFSILDAATVLVLVVAVVGLTLPDGPSRSRAVAETSAVALLDRIVAAENAARGTGEATPPRPHLSLDALVARDAALAASLTTADGAPPWVRVAGPYFAAVLLPDRDGRPVLPPVAAATTASDGFIVVFWPRDPDGSRLRALAALPDGVLWQMGGDGGGSGLADQPPTFEMVFPVGEKASVRSPAPPPDWVVMRSRRQGTAEAGPK
jgi:hypothetical protein